MTLKNKQAPSQCINDSIHWDGAFYKLRGSTQFPRFTEALNS